MSHCVVPSWEVDHNNNPTASRVSLRSHSNSITAPDVPMLDYEVAELTWENGQISMHGLGFPRVPAKPFAVSPAANTRSTASTAPAKYTWEKPRAGGTLESIVNQATSLPPSRSKILFDAVGDRGAVGDDLVPWFDSHRAAAVASTAAPSNTVTMDAMVPCSNRTDEQSTHSLPGIGTRMVGSSTRVGSCSGCVAATHDEDAALLAEKRARVARVPIAHEWSSWDQNHSMSGSATYGRDSQQMTLDTSDKEIDPAFTSTSNGSPENTTSEKQCTKTTTADDHDSVCHSRSQRDGDEEDKKKGTGKSSVSTKRSRAAAIHNQSERKRRDKINQRMKTLQKLVPNSSKTDKASMLDEVIEYLKQLQAQVQMMSRMNLSPMMMPMTMPQQLQMSMMAPMGMGLGMGMGMGIGMDMNTMGRPNIPGMPPVLHPSAFMSMGSWDASGAVAADRMQGTPAAVMPDPLSTFLACQSQPMTMEAYSRLAAMYQQLHQPPASSSKG